jgi:hypothetical protein
MRHCIPYIETGAPHHVLASDLLPARHLHTTIRVVQYAPLPHFTRHMPYAELRQVMGEPSSLTHPEAPGDNGHPTSIGVILLFLIVILRVPRITMRVEGIR